jgi:hypothetical protein
VHNDTSDKPCDNWKMIMVNYAKLWLVHTQVANQLKGAKLELRDLKARSSLLGACTSYPLPKSNLDSCAVEIKELKTKLDYSFRYNVLSPPCKMCGSVRGKLFYCNTHFLQE